MISTLKYIEAKNEAEKAAHELLDGIIEKSSGSIIDPVSYEAEHCWIFFRNRNLKLPLQGMSKDYSFLVSRYGGCMHGFNYLYDPNKCQEYVEKISKLIDSGKMEGFFR